MKQKNIALILAAGNGSRMGVDTPKQFIKINGIPLLIYSLAAFVKNEEIDEIYIVSQKKHIHYTAHIVKKYLPTALTNEDTLFKNLWENNISNILDKIKKSLAPKNEINKIKRIISGGKTRQRSVSKALKHLNKNNLANRKDIILIHDSARAMIDVKTITDTIKACKKHGASVAAIPAIDTIATIKNGFLEQVTNRAETFHLQTPQTFHFEDILNAHKNHGHKNATDDTSIALMEGIKIKAVKSSSPNKKITKFEDIKDILENL